MKFNILAIIFTALPFLAIGQQLKQKKVSELYIYFAHNSSLVTPENQLKIDSFLSIHGKNFDKIIVSSGADSTGEWHYNFMMADSRGSRVMDCLKEKGVKPETYLIYNFSEDKPLAENANIEGRRKNRYTKLEFYKKLSILENSISISANLLDGLTMEAIADSMILVFYGDESDTLKTDKNGNLSFTVPDSVQVIDFFLKDHFFSTLPLNKDVSKAVKIDVQFTKALAGNKAIFDNINFYGDQAIMFSSSYVVCDKIARFMKYNPHISVEIAGHVNVPDQPRVSEDSREFRLSEQRAETVCNYLADKGISKDRFVSRGYGNWEMLYPDAISEEDQQKNRRVEVRIIKQ
jgi:outer membrane protein OmpA-like peptidoglycan-associated protein